MAAAMLSLGDKISEELVHGQIDRLVVRWDNGYGVFCQLLTLTKAEAIQDLPLADIQTKSEKVAQVI